MNWLVVLIVSAIANLLLAELFDWFPWLAERLIQRAVGRLPTDSRKRYSDEWLAELDALPGRAVSSVIFAFRILIGSSRVRDEIAGHPAETSRMGPVLKRVFDGTAAVVFLVFFGPVLAVASLAVCLNSRGSALVREPRVGRDGHAFELFRFRTTVDARPHVLDHRLTTVGRVLLSTSLNEVPQFLNVLRGEMSLVGPRPERPEFASLFRKRVAQYDDRHRVKPGMTGWAQVHGLRGQTSLAQRVAWDNYYISHWSPWLDLKIVVLTVVALFQRPSDADPDR